MTCRVLKFKDRVRILLSGFRGAFLRNVTVAAVIVIIVISASYYVSMKVPIKGSPSQTTSSESSSSYSSSSSNTITHGQFSVLATILLGAPVSGSGPMLFDPASNSIYVVTQNPRTLTNTNNITVVSTVSDSITGSILVGQSTFSLTGLAYDSQNREIYATEANIFQVNVKSNNTNVIGVINATTNRLITSLQIPNQICACYLVVDPNNGLIYENAGQNQSGDLVINIIDPSNNSLISSLEPPELTGPYNGGSAGPIVYDSGKQEVISVGGNYGHLSGTTAYVFVISGTSIVSNFTIAGGGLNDPIYDPYNGNVYFADSDMADMSHVGRIDVVSDQSNSLVALVNFSTAVSCCAPLWYDPDNGKIYVGESFGVDYFPQLAIISGTRLIATINTTATCLGDPWGEDYAKGLLYAGDWVFSDKNNSCVGQIDFGAITSPAVYDPQNENLYIVADIYLIEIAAH